MSNQRPITDFPPPPGVASDRRVVAGVGPSVLRMVPEHRRSNLLPILLAAIAGLALLGGIVAVALGNRAPAPTPPSQIVAAPDPVSGINPAVGLAIDGDGALTEPVAAPVIIDIYSDFACPFCANFEASYAEQLMELASDPNVSLRWHPVSVLDRTPDGTGFSTQAGAIFLEVAASHPQYVWAVNDFFLHNQQELGAMTGQQIVDTMNDAGMFTLPPIETILASHLPLLGQFTNAFHQIGATGVPHVLINGQQWSPGNLPWPNESLLNAAHSAAN